MDVYINDLAAFLPNQPVANEQMEELLGMVGQLPSRTRRIILRNNRIKNRHYAIDPQTGKATHSNAQLTAEAVRKLAPYEGFSVSDIECLSCGTASPDQLMPGHAPMVHGELGGNACDILSAAGICAAGMAAFKYAWMSVALGQCRNAVATGSEIASSFMNSTFCQPSSQEKYEQLEEQPVLSFEADFLRWMLSDGSGAAFLSSTPNKEGISLRVDWIDMASYAHILPACMFAGAEQNPDGSLRGWRSFSADQQEAQRNSMLVKQDVKLLNKEIVFTAVNRALAASIDKHQLVAEEIDWFLPHYSSDFFRLPLQQHMEALGFAIPEERWFSNLENKGNTGSASIYIILEELFHSGRLKAGEKILCFVPESGRFSMCYMQLTVV